jgi:hypothetical protein
MQVKASSDQLKYKLFNIDQFDNIIGNFKSQIAEFGTSQKKLLRRGRHKILYHELESCIDSQSSKKEKESCLK